MEEGGEHKRQASKQLSAVDEESGGFDGNRGEQGGGAATLLQVQVQEGVRLLWQQPREEGNLPDRSDSARSRTGAEEDRLGPAASALFSLVVNMHPDGVGDDEWADNRDGRGGGGYGTLEELLEVITWAQLGIHDKPVGLLNVDGYYNSLLCFIDKAVDEGFIAPADRHIIVSAETTQELLYKLEVDSVFHYDPVDWISLSNQFNSGSCRCRIMSQCQAQYE
ncbi:hypothetical protein ZIOFF_056658 [Zingiber officinale]|uniref:cytokinin riboside 5'-monophosphate phosphoribohydrolase n=1 Tax=Zingiber officinale TaxID=94328 RepID=A0A8J5FI83_ZINOF|nr:hypothetical protein ZIOFF_056658 [Zingiber officinale]